MKKPTHSSTSAGMLPDGQRGHGPDPVVEEAIGRQLRKLYDDVASEPVPDRFAELLRQLEQQDGKG
ncbi:MAG: NepR family anti-sigma factor [Anderseniella sp.]|nr:NepR family anti-sigma factor [Anderseniella sp.]